MKRATKFLLGAIGAAALATLLTRQRSGDSLQGQVALITGGSSGLGYLLARDLAQAGCRLVICARREERLAWAQRQLRKQGAEVLALPCDVSSQSEVADVVNLALRTFGRIDILINNAGIIQVAPLPLLTVQDFEQAMGTMFWGTLYPTLAILPSMLNRGSGRIINITSIGGKVAIPHLLPYACAKFATVALSEGLRSELWGSGVQLTTIVPGLMRTGSHLNALFKGQQTKEFSWFALGAGMPFVSMDAERAARQILAAMQRGDAEAILSFPAQLLARVHGLFPGFTSDLAGMVAAWLLPSAQGGVTQAQPGYEVERELAPLQAQVLDSLAFMGRRAAQRYQSYPI